jgi:hypothetical protein
MIPAFERAKTVHALDRAPNVIGYYYYYYHYHYHHYYYYYYY